VASSTDITSLSFTFLYVVLAIDNASYAQKYRNNTKQTTRVCMFVHEKEKRKEILKATYHWHATEEANRYGVISALELYVVFALQKQPLEEDQIAGDYLNCF
jgi:hypothetical protein